MSDVCSEAGRKAVAQEIGVSAALVHKWAEPADVSGAKNPLDRIAGITRLTGDTRLVEWLCAVAGGTFVRDTAAVQSPADLNLATGKCGVVLVRTLEVLSVAAADGFICPVKEAPLLRMAWQTTKGCAEGTVMASERGVYAGRA
jgi:hypothetical protein